MMQVNRVIELDVVPADILEEACQWLVLRHAEDSFPSVTPCERGGGDSASVAEMFDHFGFYLTLEELRGCLSS